MGIHGENRMTAKQPPWAWGVEFIWNDNLTRTVFVSRSAANEYASKWHGRIYPLYSEDQWFLEEQEQCQNQTSQPLSMTKEEDSSLSEEIPTSKLIP